MPAFAFVPVTNEGNKRQHVSLGSKIDLFAQAEILANLKRSFIAPIGKTIQHAEKANVRELTNVSIATHIVFGLQQISTISL